MITTEFIGPDTPLPPAIARAIVAALRPELTAVRDREMGLCGNVLTV